MIISSSYAFLPANSKLRQIWKFSNEFFQTEFVDAYCVMSELRVKLLLIATHPYSVTLDACAVITALMNSPENNFQLTADRWKFNFRPNQHFSNNVIKRTINSRRIVLISYWKVKKKVIVREFFVLPSFAVRTYLRQLIFWLYIVVNIAVPCFLWRPTTLFRTACLKWRYWLQLMHHLV